MARGAHLLVVACAVLGTLLQAVTAASNCSGYMYPVDCLQSAANNCTYCCSAPIGQRCMPLSSAAALCPSTAHQVRNASSTCDNLCSSPSPHHAGLQEASSSSGGVLPLTCGACVAMPWCYYCYSTSLCMSPRDHCPHGVVLQTCAFADTSASSGSAGGGTDVWYRVVVYASTAGAAILLVVALCITGQRCRVRVLLGRLLRPETRPLLSPTNQQQQENNEPSGVAAAGPTTESSANGDGQQQLSVDVAAALLRSSTDAEGEHHNPGDDEEEEEVDATSSAAKERVGSGSSDGGTSSTSERLCQLCFDSDAVVAFLPCYHVHCCMNCSNKLRPNRPRLELSCPFCRQKINAMIRLPSIVQKKMKTN